LQNLVANITLQETDNGSKRLSKRAQQAD